MKYHNLKTGVKILVISKFKVLIFNCFKKWLFHPKIYKDKRETSLCCLLHDNYDGFIIGKYRSVTVWNSSFDV
jgi:hypothetical protein